MDKSVHKKPSILDHWKAGLTILALLIICGASLLYLLIHNRDPQVILNDVAQQRQSQQIDKNSVTTLSADDNGDQIIVGFTNQNRLIIQFRERTVGGYRIKGYRETALTSLKANRPYGLTNIVKNKRVNDFLYGILQPNQPIPRFGGKKMSLINYHGHRLYYGFAPSAKNAVVSFGTK
ncbi:hypothetical protein [Lentilactobacillus diolivorans]|uniref:Uncharacterized protein n=2 Tax=Lentilactobacillus diolivorans TaxID=179838 RepID=A0A0R1SD55_9LACO|nr:hypothetical protein [Lentilactobacillus diolivorans]KRL64402.1 hypothetical protein FC85_GL000912 [Lentilactobacillus diolivorans DSM 14421]GEP23103.1 hypothetical protein LDI01_06960 [Lentilactobacillus diolivorans]